MPPAIIDPGQYFLDWLLDIGDSEEELQEYKYLTEEEVVEAVEGKHWPDQLYLVKWKSLSYI